MSSPSVGVVFLQQAVLNEFGGRGEGGIPALGVDGVAVGAYATVASEVLEGFEDKGEQFLVGYHFSSPAMVTVT